MTSVIYYENLRVDCVQVFRLLINECPVVMKRSLGDVIGEEYQVFSRPGIVFPCCCTLTLSAGTICIAVSQLLDSVTDENMRDLSCLW